MTDDPDFHAWLDGELDEPQASLMAARVGADPKLTALAEQHRALSVRLSDAFAPIAAAPAPRRLTEAARPQAEVIDFAAERERRQRWSIAGLAAAASLAIGLALGVTLPGDRRGSFVIKGDQLAASGLLAGALDRQLASAGMHDGIRIGLSFKDQSGRLCRSFTAAAQSGLACRAGDAWAIEGLVAGQSGSGDYRMASAVDPALGALIDSRIAGEPLDAASETKAIQQGWTY
jgi:anti-sigma factor RsiW